MILCDYIIEDVELEINGYSVWANGRVEVAYNYEAPQRSVGFSGGVTITNFGPMTVKLTDENWNDCGEVNAKPGQRIFNDIIKALGEERIGSAIADGHETF